MRGIVWLLVGIVGVMGISSLRAQMKNEDKVDSVNELLRGALSAVETYNQVLAMVEQGPLHDPLKQMRDDHQKVVDRLTDEVKKEHGQPATSSGPWGVWAQAVTGGAKTFGADASLLALIQGEKHGLDEYEEFSRNSDVDERTRALVRDSYIPLQQQHIQKLETLRSKGG